MITYTYQGKTVEIIDLVIGYGGPDCGSSDDFVPYAHVELENGETHTVYTSNIHPDPERVLLGLPQIHNIFHCGLNTAIEDGQPNVCRKCGEVVTE